MENNNKKDEWVDLPVENNSTQKDEWVDVPISDEGEKKNSISQPFYKQKPISEDIGGVSQIVSQLKSPAQLPSEKAPSGTAKVDADISQPELPQHETPKYFINDTELPLNKFWQEAQKPGFKESVKQGTTSVRIDNDPAEMENFGKFINPTGDITDSPFIRSYSEKPTEISFKEEKPKEDYKAREVELSGRKKELEEAMREANRNRDGMTARKIFDELKPIYKELDEVKFNLLTDEDKVKSLTVGDAEHYFNTAIKTIIGGGADLIPSISRVAKQLNPVYQILPKKVADKYFDTKAYETVKEIKKVSDDTFADNPMLRDNYATKVTQGLASTLQYVGLGLATGGQAIPIMLLGAAQNSGAEWMTAYETTTDANKLSEEEFVQKYAPATEDIEGVKKMFSELNGKEPEDIALKASLLPMLAGGAEGLPMVGFFSKLNKISGGQFAKLAAKNKLFPKLAEKVQSLLPTATETSLGRIGMQVFEEAGQETVTEMINNFSAGQVYDETRKLLDGTADAASVGGVTGGIIQSFSEMLLKALGARKARAKTPKEKKDIENAEKYVNEVLAKAKEKPNEPMQTVPDSKEVTELKEKINAIERDAMTQKLPETALKGLNETINQMNAQLDKLRQGAVDADKKDFVEKVERREAKKEISDIEKALENKNLSDETKSALEERLSEIKQPPTPLAEAETEGAIKPTTDAERKKEEEERNVLIPPSQEAGGVTEVAPEGEPAKVETLSEKESEELYKQKPIKSGDVTFETERKSEKKPEEPKVEPTAEKPTIAKQAKGFVSMPITEARKNLDKFQGRKKEYSQQTYDRIINEVKDGTFNKSALPPILIWNKTGELLGGHSRVKAFEDLVAGKHEINPKYNKSDFENINTQIAEIETLEEAKKIAQESNQGAVQTELENAKYVRESILPQYKNKTWTELKDKLKTLYGSNTNKLLAFAHLNPKGETFGALRTVDETQSGLDRDKLHTTAKMIGEERIKHEQLTDAHENEMFDFLFKKNAIKDISQTEFSQRIGALVEKKGFDAEKPLNIERIREKNIGEVKYDEDISKVKNEIDAKKAEIEKLNNRFDKEYIEDEKGKKIKNPEWIDPSDEFNDYADMLEKKQDKVRILNKEIAELEKNKNELMRGKREEIQKGMGQVTIFDELRTQKQKGETDENTISKFEGRTTDEVKLAEPIISAIEVKAENAENLSDKELKDGIQQIEDLIGQQETKTTTTAIGDKGVKAQVADSQLPLNPKENPELKDSDLNNIITLRQIGKKLASDLSLAEGQQVRMGLIKRFKKRALGLFFPDSGIIRVRNINDIDTLAHEIGHKIDEEVFDITQNLKFNDIKKELPIIGQIAKGIKKGNQQKVIDRLKAKYGADVVDGVLQRYELRKELIDMLKSYGYPQKTVIEGIAEFVKKYVVDPDFAINKAPKFYSFFEKLLDQNEGIKTALHSARKSFKEFAQQDARQITESTISREIKDNSFIAGIKKITGGKIIYNVLDKITFIRDLDKELKKKFPDAKTSESPLYSTLSLLGADGKAKQFLENSPFYKEGNEIVLLKDTPGLLKIIKPLIKDGTFREVEGYLVALRNLELIKNGKAEAATTTKEIAEDTIRLNEEKFGKEKLDKIREDVTKYNDALLDYYFRAEKISPENQQKIKDANQFYVPFKRFFDEYETTGNIPPISKNTFDSSPSPVKTIRGSQREVVSPFESMIKNTYDLITAADRNDALKNIVSALEKIDKTLVQEIPKGKIVAYKNIKTGEIEYSFKTEKPQGAHIVTVYKDGQPHYYEIPKEYYDSYFALNEQVSNVIKILGTPSRWLQAGAVVYDPTFVARNISRDQLSATTLYSKYGYNPIDFIKGIAEASGNTEIYQRWLASGADQSFLTDTDIMMRKDYLDKKVGKRITTRWNTYKSNPLLVLQDLSRASEMGTRVGAFRNAYLKTGDVWKAMEEAREIGADYGIKGAAMNAISPLYPFLNARMQHTYITARRIKENPLASTAKGMLFITAPAIINWIANNWDEEEKKRYQALPTWRRVSMFNIHIPGTDSYLPIPKGLLGTLYGTSVESFLDYMFAEDPRAAKEFASQMWKEISPISNTMELSPQITRPVFEQWANKKAFTGQPIVPSSLEQLSPEEQYTDNTTEIMKWLGEKAGFSPLRAEALFQGYTAGAGIGALRISDEALQFVGLLDEKPEDTFTALSRLPLTKAFVTETPRGLRSSYLQDFYKNLDELEKTNKQVNNFIEEENSEKLKNYLLDEKKENYKWYIENQTELNKFKAALGFSHDLKKNIMNDKNISDEAKKTSIGNLEKSIMNMAIVANNAFEKKEKIILSESIKGLHSKKKIQESEKGGNIKKLKEELGLEQQSTTIEEKRKAFEESRRKLK